MSRPPPTPTPTYLGVVCLEEEDVVVQDLDEQLRVHPPGDTNVRDLERPLEALEDAASVAATGCMLWPRQVTKQGRGMGGGGILM